MQKVLAHIAPSVNSTNTFFRHLPELTRVIAPFHELLGKHADPPGTQGWKSLRPSESHEGKKRADLPRDKRRGGGGRPSPGDGGPEPSALHHHWGPLSCHSAPRGEARRGSHLAERARRFRAKEAPLLTGASPLASSPAQFGAGQSAMSKFGRRLPRSPSSRGLASFQAAGGPP